MSWGLSLDRGAMSWRSQDGRVDIFFSVVLGFEAWTLKVVRGPGLVL